VLTVNILACCRFRGLHLFGTHLGGTATGNIWMTATLAVITMFMMVINGLRLGGKAYLAHFCPVRCGWRRCSCPWKSSASSRRSSRWPFDCSPHDPGHILLAVLLSFIMAAGASSTELGPRRRRRRRGGQRRDHLLELFVAFLQAFIFTFLTTLFHQHVGRAASRRTRDGTCALAQRA